VRKKVLIEISSILSDSLEKEVHQGSGGLINKTSNYKVFRGVRRVFNEIRVREKLKEKMKMRLISGSKCVT